MAQEAKRDQESSLPNTHRNRFICRMVYSVFLLTVGSLLAALPLARIFDSIHHEETSYSVSSLVPHGTTMTDKSKGGKKDKDKGLKQKAIKEARDQKVKRDKQPKSAK